MITTLSSVTSSTVSYITIEEAIEKIQMGFWEEAVKTSEKARLPIIMWQGTFRERNSKGLVTPSNFVIFDYDKIPLSELEEYKKYLSEDESVRCIFVSPSRNGLKVVVNGKFNNAEEYKRIFDTFAVKYPKYLDNAACDIARACFVSYDESLYDNDNCKPLEIKGDSQMIIFNTRAIEKAWKEVEERMSFQEGNRNNFLFQVSSKLSKFGVEKEEAEKFFTQFNLPAREILSTIKSAYKSNNFGIAKHVVNKTEDIDPKCLTASVVASMIKQDHSVKYNLVLDRYELNGAPMSEQAEDILWAEIDEKFKNLGARKDLPSRLFKSALALSAEKYNPITDKLESLKWDGVSRLTPLLDHFKDVNNVSSKYLTHFLFGSIERLYKEFQNPMLVLDGKQGVGKSFFLAWLGSPFKGYFKENGQISPNDKDSRLELTCNFLYDWSEGTNLGHKDLDALKALVFSSTITERKAYAKNAEPRKIIASIAITTNGGRMLRDTTGNRRFHIVNVTDIDQSYTQKYTPEQIWAEVYETWMNNSTQWKEIDKEELAKIHFENFDEPAIWNYIRALKIEHDKYDDTFLPMHLLYASLKNIDYSIDIVRNNKIIQGYFEYEFKIQPRYRKIDGIKTLGYYGIKLKSLSTAYGKIA